MLSHAGCDEGASREERLPCGGTGRRLSLVGSRVLIDLSGQKSLAAGDCCVPPALKQTRTLFLVPLCEALLAGVHILHLAANSHNAKKELTNKKYFHMARIHIRLAADFQSFCFISIFLRLNLGQHATKDHT